MADKIQGKYPDDYRHCPPGMAMQEYLRDGDLDKAAERDGAISNLIDALRGLGSWDTQEGWCWCPGGRRWGDAVHHARCVSAQAAMTSGERFI